MGETPGFAQTMKLVNNLISAANMAAAFEGLVFGAKAGLDPDLMVHAFRLTAGAYAEVAVVSGAGGVVPVPWGEVYVDLEQVRTG
jgi:3-hydroxyisobutyrate dehydrogenase-like beta-hydroxyacid dehydrogenase